MFQRFNNSMYKVEESNESSERIPLRSGSFWCLGWNLWHFQSPFDKEGPFGVHYFGLTRAIFGLLVTPVRVIRSAKTRQPWARLMSVHFCMQISYSNGTKELSDPLCVKRANKNSATGNIRCLLHIWRSIHYCIIEILLWYRKLWKPIQDHITGHHCVLAAMKINLRIQT